MSKWKVTVVKPRKNDGGNLFLRARVKQDGKWIDNRISSNTTDREEARKQADQLEKDLNSAPADGQCTLVKHVIEARLLSMTSSKRSKKTTINGLKNAKKAIIPILGEVLIEDFSKAHIKQMRRELLERLSPITVRTYEGVFSAAWNWAIEEELIEKPWPKIKRVKARATGNKRPYTDQEVIDVLNWVRGYRGGRYYPALQFIADTGRRVREILAIKGVDLNFKNNTISIKQQKAGRSLNVSIPVPASTMELVKGTALDGFAFASHGHGGRARHPNPKMAIRQETILSVVKKAIKDLGIVDGHRLDTHSFRRAFVASAERSGVPGDVGRRITGHETQAMWEHYQSQAVGDDLHAVVNQIHDKRESLSPRPSQFPSQSSQQIKKSSGTQSSAFKACGRERSGDLIFTNCQKDSPESTDVEPIIPDGRWEGSSDPRQQKAESGASIWGRIEPDIEVASKWAADHPQVMLRILNDPELRKMLRDALYALGLIHETQNRMEA